MIMIFKVCVWIGSVIVFFIVVEFSKWLKFKKNRSYSVICSCSCLIGVSAL